MKVRTIARKCQNSTILICWLALIFLQWPQVGSAIPINNETIHLEEAFHRIGQKYDVYFNYDRSIASDITVQYEDGHRSLEEAMDYVLKNTNLGYRIFDQRFVVVFLNNEQGIESLKEMIGHVQGFVNEQEAVKKHRSQSVTPLKTLTAHEVYKKRLVFGISGQVVDDVGEPLIGVNVQVKGTDKGTATDFEGQFKLDDIDENAVLVVSYVGYQKQEVSVAGKSNLTITMISDSQLLDEIVVIGYGTAKKSDLTGSVAQIDAKTFENQSMTQFTDMITGTVAGMNTNQGTSARGGGALQIRGPKSLNASTQPMVVLDGSIFNGSIDEINPADIATIDILKDASSAAIFGARSAAGIILITTKRGKTGKPTISFSGSTGITDAENNKLQPFDAQGYLDFRRDVLIDMRTGNPDYYFYNPNNLPQGVALEDWRNANSNSQPDNSLEWLSRLGFFDVEIENYTSGKTVDWYKKVVNPGIKQDFNLSIGGGLGGSNYYWSVGYTNNDGIIIGDKFSTLRSKLNVDFKITEWLEIGMNAQFSNNNESGVPANLSGMFIMSPYGSVFNSDGSPKWYPNDYNVVNPLLDYYLQEKFNESNSIFVPVFAKVKFPFDIEYKLSFQPRYQFLKDYNFWPSTTITGGSLHSKGYGTRLDGSSFGWILDNLIHWNKKIGIHNFDLTLLYSTESEKNYMSITTNETFLPNENLIFNGLQLGTNPSLTNNDRQVTGDAAMARLNYTLLDKYLFTASIRRDGYSAFGKKTPRAVFPAFAFAWKISEEDFFNVDGVNQLKLRLSWGINGNRDIGAYAALAQIEPNLYYDGINTQVGVKNSSLANYSLAWEKTKSINVGVDFGLLENRFNISADYYDITTNDLLMNRLLPALTGFRNITTNLGELGNRGFEMTLNSNNITSSKFSWETDLTFSLNRNKIKRLFGDYEEVSINGENIRREVPDYTNEWFPGQALDRVWNYNVTGIWQFDEADAASPYRLVPGDFKAEDVDNNGVYEALSDKQFIGYKAPRFRIGIRNDFTFLQNFTASFFIRADLGHMGAYREALNQSGATYDKRNRQAIPYWTSAKPSNEYARLLTNITSFGGGLMVYRSLSFLRIQDFSCSYNLPDRLTNKIKLNNLRIYGSIRNLYSFDKWPGWDPESGNIPMPRTFSAGLSFSL